MIAPHLAYGQYLCGQRGSRRSSFRPLIAPNHAPEELLENPLLTFARETIKYAFSVLKSYALKVKVSGRLGMSRRQNS